MSENTDFDLLREAVEKQLPMRVLVKRKRSWKFHCPICTLIHPYNISRLYHKQPYCDICGQKIDWDGIYI